MRILAHGFLRLRCGDCGHDNRVITRFLLKQAGVKADEADSGAVTLIERFGSAANLNIHLHCLVLVVIPSNGATQTRTDGKLVLVMWSRKAST